MSYTTHMQPGGGSHVLWWYCPLCTITGTLDVDPGCVHCHGFGLTDDIEGWEAEATFAPLPPATPDRPCPDCALRPGSPEEEAGDLNSILDPHRPFMCHQGMPMVNGEYRPPMMAAGVPIGCNPCRGWVDWCRTGKRPDKPYRQMAERDTEL